MLFGLVLVRLFELFILVRLVVYVGLLLWVVLVKFVGWLFWQ